MGYCKTGGADRGWPYRAFLAMVRHWPSPAGQWQLWDESVLGVTARDLFPEGTQQESQGRTTRGEGGPGLPAVGPKLRSGELRPGEEKTWRSVKFSLHM